MGPGCPHDLHPHSGYPERRCRMKRRITGLHAADRCAADQIPDGVFLVRVQRVQFRRQAQKPYYALALAVLEPSRSAGHILSSRLYCTPKALWKLNWFLNGINVGYEVVLPGQRPIELDLQIPSRRWGTWIRSFWQNRVNSMMPCRSKRSQESRSE